MIDDLLMLFQNLIGNWHIYIKDTFGWKNIFEICIIVAILCVYNTGAYNYSMASNYNRVQRPAMVLVNNSQSDIIINRETLDDLVSHDLIPDRLKK